MKSSWLEKSNESVGSYYFADNWEQIDHIFLWSKTAHLKKCGTVKKRIFFNSAGTPNSYKIHSGTGLSDHLPLKAEIHFKSEP